jgi:3-(3-hydroxy-phenyl)propionate hydroxylase
MSRVDHAGEVVIVGAGPVGCAAALLLADRGIAVTVLERRAEPHPLPRAVHLDDETVRILHRAGVSDAFLALSRPATGLRLLDSDHRVMAEFPREVAASANGFPFANMFHQPDLEAVLLDRIDRHPLVALQRGVEVFGAITDTGGAPHADVYLQCRSVDTAQPFTLSSRFVLGCDGANSTLRDLLGIDMQDLKFTERWLVIDINSEQRLDFWGGIDQICHPRRPATFMRVIDNRYRWEFQLRDGEDERDLIAPHALGEQLRPWTGRSDLAGLDIVRAATYTFRAALARRFRRGNVFLLGDAAHLTPPFIGQGLGAGLRDAANLSWKLAHVLTGRAHPDLLASYETERRPHARTLIKRAVMLGWAMSGGQDRAARVRRIALALAVKSPQIRRAIAKPVTPALTRGALDRNRFTDREFRVGSLIPNPIVRTSHGDRLRLDAVLGDDTVLLTSDPVERDVADRCRQAAIAVVRLRPATDTPATEPPGSTGLFIDGEAGVFRHLLDHPGRAILIRPDRVIAATSRHGIPRLPWTCPTPRGRTALPLSDRYAIDRRVT